LKSGSSAAIDNPAPASITLLWYRQDASSSTRQQVQILTSNIISFISQLSILISPEQIIIYTINNTTYFSKQYLMNMIRNYKIKYGGCIVLGFICISVSQIHSIDRTLVYISPKKVHSEKWRLTNLKL
jgi:hypothetical protein